MGYCWWFVRNQLTSWGTGNWNPIIYEVFYTIPKVSWYGTYIPLFTRWTSTIQKVGVVWDFWTTINRHGVQTFGYPSQVTSLTSGAVRLSWCGVSSGAHMPIGEAGETLKGNSSEPTPVLVSGSKSIKIKRSWLVYHISILWYQKLSHWAFSWVKKPVFVVLFVQILVEVSVVTYCRIVVFFIFYCFFLPVINGVITLINGLING